jgi:tetratricopeptide (TPR) repeat protein
VLEKGAKESPDNSGLQFVLGSAYLKMGQSDKAVAHLRAAAEEEGKPKRDPEILNNVAYTLAENKTNLALAKEYGEEALKELDARSSDDVIAIDTGAEVTYQLSLLWDTMGWVYFQSGDTTRAESYVRAAWLLGQDAIVGEHLGEIYEKQGKSKEAAHVYELALAAQASPRFRMTQAAATVGAPLLSPFDANAYQTQRNKLLSHYEKLTGKKPSAEIRRLPNGEWTKTPAEQLSELRTVKLGKQPSLLGSAEFSIVFTQGKIESVEYVSGEESLEGLTAKLKAAHFQIEFPAGSQAKILRRAELSCNPSSGCMAVLVPAASARVPKEIRQ